MDFLDYLLYDVYSNHVVQILHDIIICEETASECLPYASTAPNIVQISAFLITKDRLSSFEMCWFEKC
jgi:hypothetical protein